MPLSNRHTKCPRLTRPRQRHVEASAGEAPAETLAGPSFGPAGEEAGKPWRLGLTFVFFLGGGVGSRYRAERSLRFLGYCSNRVLSLGFGDW